MGSPARSSAPALSVAAALCLLPLSASAQAPRGLREDLEVVGAALDRAVRQVSRPGALAFSGRATRAYALPGVGTVFVLPARTLPTRRASRPAEAPAARALGDALANLQESLRRVRTPELRAQIERSLEAVRQAQAQLRSLPLPAVGPVPVELPPMSEFAAEVEAQLAHQARAMREAQRASRDAQRRFREEWEAEVRALNAQTNAFRLEADKAREDAERALRDQLGVPWPELGEVPLPPAPPEPAIAPSAAAVPAVPHVPAAPPAPHVAAAPHVQAPPRLPAAPWSLWFEADEGPDVGDADDVVRGVRDAVLGVLETEGERLARQDAGDSVIVAVDFVPRAGAAAARTLVVRARRKDIQERRAGRIAAEEFRRRVEASEY